MEQVSELWLLSLDKGRLRGDLLTITSKDVVEEWELVFSSRKQAI